MVNKEYLKYYISQKSTLAGEWQQMWKEELSIVSFVNPPPLINQSVLRHLKRRVGVQGKLIDNWIENKAVHMS